MGMATATFLCLLMKYISAAPVCNSTRLKFNQHGLCSPNGSVKIWDCATCQPGLGQSVECGQIYKLGTKVGCEPCTTGTYSDTYDISQCKKCNPCQKNEMKSGRCTSFKDSTTCTCKSGYYRDTHTRACKPCSWCCGDKSNEYVPECNALQVAPGKQCSFQTVKSCAPTTPAPTTPAPTTPAQTTVATSPSTNPPTTGISSSSSSAPRTIEKTTMTKKDNTKTSSNSLLPTEMSNDKGIAKDPPEGESWLKALSIAACFIACIFITVYCLNKKRKESTSPNPTCSCTASGSTSPNPYTCTCTASGQPLLQGNDRENNSNGSRPEECVNLNPSAAAAAYHVPQGPDGVEPPQANGMSGLPTRRLDERELSLISERLGTKIKDLKHDIMQTLCKMLNVQVNGKDYRNLDSFCNLDYYEKQNLKKDNPMEDIIEIMVRDLKTLESLLNELYNISRGDVVEELYKIAQGQ